jgi:hypothetical protein
MMPRPRSRKRPVVKVNAEALAQEVLQIRRETGEGTPVAILTGNREWRLVITQPEAQAHLAYWPGGDVTYAGCPVIMRMALDAPRVMPTQQELEDALLGGD